MATTCVDIMAKARLVRVMLKQGPLTKFIGTVRRVGALTELRHAETATIRNDKAGSCRRIRP